MPPKHCGSMRQSCKLGSIVQFYMEARKFCSNSLTVERRFLKPIARVQLSFGVQWCGTLGPSCLYFRGRLKSTLVVQIPKQLTGQPYPNVAQWILHSPTERFFRGSIPLVGTQVNSNYNHKETKWVAVHGVLVHTTT